MDFISKSFQLRTVQDKIKDNDLNLIPQADKDKNSVRYETDFRNLVK